MKERNLDFDTPVDRRNTGSLKYDFAVERGKPADILPLWVADMDFKTSSFVQDALMEQVQHGVYGYSESKEEYFEALKNWMKKQHDWEIEQKWLVKTPGIVFALAMAVKAYTEKGDGVLIQQPVYYPFSEVIRDNGRRIVNSPLVREEDGSYHMDLQDFEQKIQAEHIKLFLLCSPHNPVGRVWDEETLRKLGEICLKNNVVVVSDEIHADFVFEGKHHVFASLSEEIRNITVTCTAPSKTFNIAGLQVSNILIANDSLRRKFIHQVNAAGYSQVNAAGLVACRAAYEHGEEWFLGVKAYIKANIDFVDAFLKENLPQITMRRPEGTYLVWLDFRSLGLSNEKLEDLIVHKAGLWLDSGAIFGAAGEGFQRINTACQRATLEEALKRIERAVKDLS